MNCVQQGSRVVEQCLRCSALQGTDEVIHKDLQELVELLEALGEFLGSPVRWVLQLVHSQDIINVHCEILKGVGWQGGLPSEGLAHIPCCFSGSTEVGWAEGPTHLNGAGNHNLDWVVIRLLRQNIAEVELFSLGDH